MSTQNTNDTIDYINKQINSYLDKYCYGNIINPVKYSVQAGGKRFRPMLVLLTADNFCVQRDKSIPFAVAIELIHTYSLIHDDLPCMDNDDVRRGLPTCHKKFDEASAVLAGDTLLNLAFEIMTDALKNDFTKSNLLAMQEIINASGSKGMINGQVLDMSYENMTITENDLLKMYELKTGKLINASIRVGAILGNASKTQLSIIDDISYNLGIAFQIKDDILDIIGDENKIGKPINSDIKNNKSTYVSINGLQKAKIFYEELSNNVLQNLSTLEMNETPIFEYISSLINRDM